MPHPVHPHLCKGGCRHKGGGACPAQPHVCILFVHEQWWGGGKRGVGVPFPAPFKQKWGWGVKGGVCPILCAPPFMCTQGCGCKGGGALSHPMFVCPVCM